MLYCSILLHVTCFHCLDRRLTCNLKSWNSLWILNRRSTISFDRYGLLQELGNWCWKLLHYYQCIYSPFLDLGRFFSFFIPYTVGRTPWTRDQSVARPLPTHRTTQTQNKRIQTSMPRLGFERTTSVFQRAKTVHTSDHAGPLWSPPLMNTISNFTLFYATMRWRYVCSAACFLSRVVCSCYQHRDRLKLNSVASVRKRTISNERPPLVGEVSVKLLRIESVAWSAEQIPTAVNLGFLDRSRYFFFHVAQLSSRGWVDPVPDPLLLRKSGRAGSRTRDLWICSQKLWPLDHRGGHRDRHFFYCSCSC
jgi:hypothetical protein